METKFTKGEWKIDGNEDYCTILTDNDVICSSIIMNDESETVNANFKLIAAAPELLDALFNICKDAEIMALGEKGDHVSISIDVINKGIKAIKKAIE
jgi:hypothetical protein